MKKKQQELQEEVEEKNKWAFDLDEQIKQLETALKGREEHIAGLEGSLEEKERLEEELKKRLTEAQDLNNQILNSGGWKVLKKYYNLKEISMIALQAMAHPLQLSKVANRTYWYGFLRHLKSGNYAYILERMSYYIKTEPSQIQLELMQEAHVDEVLTFPIVKNPKVSIVIPVYNQFHYTYNCLKSILAHTDDIDYEIIIADDVSSDETRHIEHFCKNIKVVRNDVNLGFLLNCNNAAKEARGKYIFFLNNDTNVQEDWLSTLLETIENDNTIGMVGSKLVYEDSRQQEAGGIIWNDASGWNFGRLDNPEKPEYNYVKEVDYISGAAIMIRKSLWDEIGGFDERYVPAYYEDSDLAFEVRKHGYKVVLQPKSVVVHFEGISNGTDTGSGIKKYQVVNNEKFFDKWQEVLEIEHFPNAQDVFLARDRSKGKKHILTIDHYVPHFDQDAGSRTVFGYIKMFLDSNYSVKFIGDNFYPHEPYTSILEQMGVEVLFGTWYANNWQEWLQNNGKYFDYIFINRPHISEKYIDILNETTNAKIIYYGHDLHFLRDKREYLLTGNKAKLKSAEMWKDREFSLMHKSDISLYPSEVEVKEIHSIDSAINVQSIPAYLFDNFPQRKIDRMQCRDIMFVGGFGHTPNVDAVLWFIAKVWPSIKKELPDLKFYIVGSKPTEEIKKLVSSDVIVTGFVSDEELMGYYQNCRISVVPLRYGAGIKGKVVEALYEQIPIVTTSVGSEGLENAENYMIIEDDAEVFANEIVSLYANETKLAELSTKGLDYCKQYFSYEHARDVLKNVFSFGGSNDR